VVSFDDVVRVLLDDVARAWHELVDNAWVRCSVSGHLPPARKLLPGGMGDRFGSERATLLHLGQCEDQRPNRLDPSLRVGSLLSLALRGRAMCRKDHLVRLDWISHEASYQLRQPEASDRLRHRGGRGIDHVSSRQHVGDGLRHPATVHVACGSVWQAMLSSENNSNHECDVAALPHVWIAGGVAAIGMAVAFWGRALVGSG
jgi:hypothetical protein